jgi:hypothetical protein
MYDLQLDIEPHLPFDMGHLAVLDLGTSVKGTKYYGCYHQARHSARISLDPRGIFANGTSPTYYVKSIMLLLDYVRTRHQRQRSEASEMVQTLS